MSNKRDEIVRHIQAEIERGRWRTGDKIPSQYQLAERFGVNKLTANKAVTELVAKGLLEVRRGPAGTVVSKTTPRHKGVLAQLVSLSGAYGRDLLKGGQQAARMREYALVYSQITPDDDPADYWDWLRSVNPMGIVTSGHGTIPLDIDFPVVYLDSVPIDRLDKNWITFDNVSGGAELARNLIELGKRDLVFIMIYGGAKSCETRVDSFMREARRLGVDFGPERIFRPSAHEDADFNMLWREVKARFPNIDAIALDNSNDSLRNLIMALEADGRRVPEDVSVAGFGVRNNKTQNVFDPTLMVQDFIDAGFRAMNHLIDLIEGERKPPVQEILPMAFWMGSTTRPATDGSIVGS